MNSIDLDAIKNKVVFLEEGEHSLAITNFTQSQKDTILDYFDYLYQSKNAQIIFDQIFQINEPVRIMASNFFGASANSIELGGGYIQS